MLTCKVGNTLINCFDGKYDRHTLKKWDEEKRLICPDCEKLYEYCHGEVVSPYFRHKEKSKECDGIYHEAETEEHIKGKMILFKWLLKLQEKGLISNVKLESYIPETRQRPDLYFEKDGQIYVIEFQCSPIATEYIERHRLYELANIKDIWIMGTEKYNLHIAQKYILHSQYYKFIEKHSNFYLLVNKENIICNKNVILNNLPYKKSRIRDYYQYKLDDFTINRYLNLKENILQVFIDKDIANYNKHNSKIKHFDIQEYMMQLEKERIIKEEKQILEKSKKYCEFFKKYINKEIYLINSSKNKIPNHIRFKFLKNFCVSDFYMENYFIKELEFLENKNVDTYIFMIPKYHHYFNCLGFSRYIRVGEFNSKIINFFRSYGFKNIKYIDDIKLEDII